MSGREINFDLNGTRVSAKVAPSDRLSSMLRDHLGLIGTKVGCDAGDCGACTVLIDGEPCCACLVPAGQVTGAKVTTVEGLKANGALSRLQESFLHFGAAQCGICTPGMLVAAAALLARNPNPSRDDAADALGGVLCRCTGYRKIVDAVVHASGFNVGDTFPAAGASVGARIRRLDGDPKVAGTEAFGADLTPDDAVMVRVVRSPHHHAAFVLGDIVGFVKKYPGVLAVFTAADVPGRNCFGVIPAFADQPVFAETMVRHRGEAVAAIAGERAAMKDLDLDAFPVTWEPLPHVMTPAEAQSKGAPRLHDGRDGNVLVRGRVERGDVAAGFAQAAHIADGRFSTPFIEHAYIEPEAGFARRIGDRIEIFASTQAPHMDRDTVAEIMALDTAQVRVVPTACGGGFGSKLDISLQPYIAIAAWHLNRPAALAYSRQESMQSTTKRHPSEITARVGCDAAGKITAFEFEGVFNTGAYASWGPTVANRVPVHASGPYFTPNYAARSVAVHTHCPPSGAFRGFGVPQSAIAQECLYDELAAKLGIDRLEFRLRNALTNGQATVTGQVFAEGVGITACLEALRPAWDWANAEASRANGQAKETSLRRGVGIASCWYGCGNTSLPNPSTIRIGLGPDGRVVLHQGAVDIGQGANTVIAQIAADALGVPVHSLELLGGDTDLTPDAGKTSASRQTFISGMAAKLAGDSLRRKILRHANVSKAACIVVKPGTIELTDGGTVTGIDLAQLETDEFGYVFRGEETYDPPTKSLDEKGQGEPYAIYGYGAQIMELSVDTILGTVKLHRLVAAHDVGRAINPVLVEGQIEGGTAQGIGMALMENYIPGRTENLHDYLIPTFGDMPEVESIIVEMADAVGPYGAKGLGEHVLIPTAPAILNAIRDATGALIRDLPATPDKVRAAIKALKA
jgi:CO/xanthine dehydrogenase Mo-binding subunit/aerobic-type carbon monoxide dehydrogenase small subunit (CoxS/CutS family)